MNKLDELVSILPQETQEKLSGKMTYDGNCPSLDEIYFHIERLNNKINQLSNELSMAKSK